MNLALGQYDSIVYLLQQGTWDGQPAKVIVCIRVTFDVVVLGEMRYSSLLSFPRITSH